jgi:exopolysaccharide biosynthesis polyprenyl glycosylphosphotransferase
VAVTNRASPHPVEQSAGPDTQPLYLVRAQRGDARRPSRSSLRPSPRTWQALTQLLVAGTDLVALLLPDLTRSSGRLPLVTFALVAVLLMVAQRSYRPRLRLSVLDEIPVILPATVTAAVGVTIAVHLWTLDPLTHTFAAMAGAAIGCQLVVRALLYALLRSLRRHRRLLRRCAVLGSGPIARRLAELLTADPAYGLHIVGYIAPPPVEEFTPPLRRLGTADRLWQIVRRDTVDVLLVADGDVAEGLVVEALRAEPGRRPDVLVLPRLHEIGVRRRDRDQVGDIPLEQVIRHSRNSLALAVKRGIDMLCSALGLLVLLPLLAVIALAVRLETGPGVLFRQERIGRDGKPFDLLKFRSMRPADATESQTRWNISDDERIGPIGRVLRKTSLDELPQLWNVLRGQMSLVGPRPERPYFVQEFAVAHPAYLHRHRFRAGLTGLSQVNGLRGDTSIADRVRYDNSYIDNWSLWLDAKILLSTFRAVIRGSGR